MLELGVPFGDERRPGKGAQIEYTEGEAFELLVAMTLLDAGLTQGDVTFLLKYERGAIAHAFEAIMNNRPALRNMILARQRPDGPRRPVWGEKPSDPKEARNWENRRDYADTSYFMAFRKVELREALPSSAKIDPKVPFIYQPKYFVGLSKFFEEMERLATASNDNIRMVIELSNLADYLVHYLHEAPVVKRGRRKREDDAAQR